MGIAHPNTDSRLARYTHSEGYLEWLEASRVARKLSDEEIGDRVRRLEETREHYEQRFDTTDPSTVS